MDAPTATRFCVNRADLHATRLLPDPDGPTARALADGEVRLEVRSFALTANNITYAAFGDKMKYWQFFPSGAEGWGCIPVWGFAEVVESRNAEVATGQRVYGYLPMGHYLVVQAARVNRRGFMDASAHRRELAAIYNQLVFCAADPAYDPAREGQQAVLRPLFTTSFLIDDFMAENEFFGARQLLLSSASSKTAYGTAFCLARRAGGPTVHGLTSAGNLDFTRGLGCYGALTRYEDVTRLDPDLPTVYIDFAGDAGLRRTIHGHFGAALKYSCSVGGSHWEALGGAGDLPGPRPELFFAPAQGKKRSAPPPEGWGAAGFEERLGEAWSAFMQKVNDPVRPWLVIHADRGAEAVSAAYQQLLAGRSDPRVGLMLAP
ncbi:MAG: DUF2855 family protein [Hylemonella sp.]|nr:DUF2855 family protein [Hylemonella sp.]